MQSLINLMQACAASTSDPILIERAVKLSRHFEIRLMVQEIIDACFHGWTR